MKSATIRQAALAFLERSPSSEWVRAKMVEDALLGRTEMLPGDFWLPGETRDELVRGPRGEIELELFTMADEGLIEYRAHGGFRLKEKS